MFNSKFLSRFANVVGVGGCEWSVLERVFGAMVEAVAIGCVGRARMVVCGWRWRGWVEKAKRSNLGGKGRREGGRGLEILCGGVLEGKEEGELDWTVLSVGRGEMSRNLLLGWS